MSNQDITAVLLGLYNSACDPGDIKDGYPPIHVHEAELQIINLIESIIPEKRTTKYPPTKKYKYEYENGYNTGYNQAIEDIKSKLIGEE